MKPKQHIKCFISVISNVEKSVKLYYQLIYWPFIIYIQMLFLCLLIFFFFVCLSTFLPQLPNGVTYHPNTHQDRLGKLQEHLRMLSVLFRKLRLVYDKCTENCAGLEPIPPEVTTHFHISLYTVQGHSSTKSM